MLLPVDCEGSQMGNPLPSCLAVGLLHPHVQEFRGATGLCSLSLLPVCAAWLWYLGTTMATGCDAAELDLRCELMKGWVGIVWAGTPRSAAHPAVGYVSFLHRHFL